MTFAPYRIRGILDEIAPQCPDAQIVIQALRHAVVRLENIMDDPCTNPDGNAEKAWRAIAETAEILDEWRVDVIRAAAKDA